MMNFIIMTLSFTVGILLASAVACVIMLQPVVVKFYMKHYVKMVKDMEDIFDDVI